MLNKTISFYCLFLSGVQAGELINQNINNGPYIAQSSIRWSKMGHKVGMPLGTILGTLSSTALASLLTGPMTVVVAPVGNIVGTNIGGAVGIIAGGSVGSALAVSKISYDNRSLIKSNVIQKGRWIKKSLVNFKCKKELNPLLDHIKIDFRAIDNKLLARIK